MFGTSTIDLGDPTTMLTFIGNFFTSLKATVGPVILWALGLGILFALVGIIYAMIRKARSKIH